MSIKLMDTRGTEIPVEYMTFNGGEESVKITGSLEGLEVVAIEFKRPTSLEIMRLILLVDAIRRITWDIGIVLKLSYVPYARQDRVCNEGEAHSLKVFCELINSLKLVGVFVMDPHSDVVEALLDNCFIRRQDDILKSLEDRNYFGNYEVLVSPDAGAMKKIFKAAKVLSTYKTISCDKVRDLKTGNIIETIVHDTKGIHGSDCLIVDDICDGGRTFIEIAKVLKEHGAASVGLFVTHGIFSKGLKLEGIDRIYTTDSYTDPEDDEVVTARHLTVFKYGEDYE